MSQRMRTAGPNYRLIRRTPDSTFGIRSCQLGTDVPAPTHKGGFRLLAVPNIGFVSLDDSS